MVWHPNYTITNKLIVSMRRIGEAIGEINGLALSSTVLARLELAARELSIHASTSIEGNPLPLTDVKRLLKAKTSHIRDTEREILNYNTALQTIHADVKSGKFRLDIPTIKAIQVTVVDGLMLSSDHVGRTRREPVLIRDSRRPDEVVFIPPDHADIERLAGDLINFVNQSSEEIDSIILAGLFHR